MSKCFQNHFAGYGNAASYSRYSSDQQGERSIEQQENAQDDVAKRNGHKFGDGMRFRDEAVSGTKRNRKGLNAMEQAAKEGKFKVLYLYNVSRLARESVIAMPLLKRLVNKYGVRVISVSDGVDSTNENWVMYSSILAVIAEQYLKDLAINVHRGQAANASSGHSNGDTCYGYESVPDPNASSKGRDRRIPKIRVVKQDHAKYVVLIFFWYVVERRTIRWIVRELNRIGAPRRSPRGKRNVMWRHQYVTQILKNPKYIGIWPWGKTKIVRDPETGDVKHELRLPEEMEGWIYEDETLRIVEVELFKQAQVLLLEQAEKSKPRHNKNGKFKNAEGNRRDLGPKHLLSGLLFCAECGRAYNKAGGHGNYFQCSGYPTGKCGSYTQLKQERGEAMILKVVEDHMMVDDYWRELVWKATEKAWHAERAVVPTDSSGLKSRLTDVTKRINNLVNLITDGEVIPEFSQKLAELRNEKQGLLGQIEELALKEEKVKTPLTRENVMADLTRLRDVLRSATPAAAYALRTLVGGRIELQQVIAPGLRRAERRARTPRTCPRVAKRQYPSLQGHRGRRRHRPLEIRPGPQGDRQAGRDCH